MDKRSRFQSDYGDTKDYNFAAQPFSPGNAHLKCGGFDLKNFYNAEQISFITSESGKCFLISLIFCCNHLSCVFHSQVVPVMSVVLNK